MTQPLAIDLFCGLGGWAEGLLAEGWRVVGFDIEPHDYGTGSYPGQLVIQDVLTLHGSQFKTASLIVASPPCQAYSYRAMPWSRAKALPPPDNTLFDACFRIQREACEAAGRYIPLIVENVRGAVNWVSHPCKWHFGSYYLWGDVPALMPPAVAFKVAGFRFDGSSGSFQTASVTKTVGHANKRDGYSHTRHLRNQRESEALHHAGNGDGTKFHISGHAWYRESHGKLSSKSNSRKAASAMIAKIPFPLAVHIARTFKP